MRRLLPLAIYTCCALADPARAGWSAAAWPSPTAQRVTAPDTNTALVSVLPTTGLWARRMDVRLDQAASTNFGAVSPDWYLDFGPECDNATTPFSTNLIGGYTGTARTVSYSMLFDIQADLDSNTVLYSEAWTNTSTCTNLFSWDGAFSGASNVTLGGAVGSNWLAVSLSETNVGVLTNLPLQTIDVWSMDAYRAVVERWMAVNWTYANATNYPQAGEYEREVVANSLKPKFYRQARENLAAVKGWLESAAPSFVDWREARQGDFDAYFQTPTNWYWQWYFPTNYPDAPSTGQWVQVRPQGFPMLSLERLETYAGLPYDSISAVVTGEVDGWVVGNLNTLTVTNGVYTNETRRRRWWDWTPNRPLGGAGPPLYATQSWQAIYYLAPASAYTNATSNEVKMVTTCYPETDGDEFDEYWWEVRTSEANSNGFFSIEWRWEWWDALSTNPTPATSAVYWATYVTNAVTLTNTYWCRSPWISTNGTSLDYGFSKLTNVFGELQYTVREVLPACACPSQYVGFADCPTDTPANVFGDWGWKPSSTNPDEFCSSMLTNVSESWTMWNTNGMLGCYTYPGAWKSVYVSTNVSAIPQAYTNNDMDEVAAYYFVVYSYSGADAEAPCGSPAPGADSETWSGVQIECAVWGATEFLSPDIVRTGCGGGWDGLGDGYWVKIVGGPVSCGWPWTTNGLASRVARALLVNDIWTNRPSDRTAYVAMRDPMWDPAWTSAWTTSHLPVEDEWGRVWTSGVLSAYEAFTNDATPYYWNTNFTGKRLPWGPDCNTNDPVRGYQIMDARLLLHWDFDY